MQWHLLTPWKLIRKVLGERFAGQYHGSLKRGTQPLLASGLEFGNSLEALCGGQFGLKKNDLNFNNNNWDAHVVKQTIWQVLPHYAGTY